jgi:hypothetical protein
MKIHKKLIKNTNSIIRIMKIIVIEVRNVLVSDHMIRNFRSYEPNLPSEIHQLFKSLKPNENLDSQLKILFVTGYGLGSHYYAIEPIIKAALYQRGHKVIGVICDRSVPSCELSTDSKFAKREGLTPIRFMYGLQANTRDRLCNICCNNAKEIQNTLAQETILLSKYLDEQLINDARIFAKASFHESLKKININGINIGEDIYATILRATYSGVITEASGNSEIIEQYILSGFLQVHLYMRLFEDVRPDRVALIHGIYQIHGIATKVASKMNIPVIVMGGGGIRKNTLIACLGETYHHQLINESNKIWENRKLDQEEINNVLSYAIKKRVDGQSVDYLNYHPNPITDRTKIVEMLGVSGFKRVLVFYTNVLWDAQIIYKSNIFNDIFDCVKYLVKLSRENKDILLIIRVHPGEVKSIVPTNTKMFDFLHEIGATNIQNIKIIKPESDISSYVLADFADANIVYGTKMALEMALMKTNVLICGETFSRNKGIGVDINTIEQFKQELLNITPSKEVLEDRYDKALRYAHYFYFERMIDFPISSNNSALGSYIKPNLTEKAINEKGVEKIVNLIEKLIPTYSNYKK